jgi:hypothetical protein
MRLARLRHQLLIAMGLPACWTQQAPEPTLPPARPAAPAGFDRAACPRDSIPETVCGAREEDLGRCGPHGDSLASFDDFKLYLTENDDEKKTYRRFDLDAKATEDYRAAIAADGLAVNEQCCYSRCTPVPVGRLDAPTPDRRLVYDTRCIPQPPQGTSVPSPSDPACPAAVRFDGALRPYASTEDSTCCYSVPSRKLEIRPVRGRPARIGGEPHFADIGATAAWRAPGLPTSADALPRALRDRLSAAWLEAAREEHASIAAFANLSLRLLSLGAPPDLIAGAHAAALDEIRHARLAFELASSYAGAPLAPAHFSAAARMSAAGDLAALALETLLDGCINETISAALASSAASSATDPALAAALAGVASDEARHAELAWQIVAWCVRTSGPALLPALRETAAAAALASPTRSPDPRDDLAAHGVLGDAALAAARAGVLREIVAPCLAALELAEEHGSVSSDKIVGLFADQPDLIEGISEEAMRARAAYPLRLAEG